MRIRPTLARLPALHPKAAPFHQTPLRTVRASIASRYTIDVEDLMVLVGDPFASHRYPRLSAKLYRRIGLERFFRVGPLPLLLLTALSAMGLVWQSLSWFRAYPPWLLPVTIVLGIATAVTAAKNLREARVQRYKDQWKPVLDSMVRSLEAHTTGLVLDRNKLPEQRHYPFSVGLYQNVERMVGHELNFEAFGAQFEDFFMEGDVRQLYETVQRCFYLSILAELHMSLTKHLGDRRFSITPLVSLIKADLALIDRVDSPAVFEATWDLFGIWHELLEKSDIPARTGTDELEHLSQRHAAFEFLNDLELVTALKEFYGAVLDKRS